jgi:hypothetical protein
MIAPLAEAIPHRVKRRADPAGLWIAAESLIYADFDPVEAVALFATDRLTFLGLACCAVFLALYSAQRFLVASAIRFRAAGLSFRLLAGISLWAFNAAQRLRLCSRDSSTGSSTHPPAFARGWA